MPRLSANLTTLYRDIPFLDRFAMAARAGFRHVEFQFPYLEAKADIRTALDANGLDLVLMNTPPGDRAAGEIGLAVLPDRRDEFRRSIDLALDYATALGSPRLHCVAGVVPPGSDRGALEDCFVENLRHAAGEAYRAGVKLLVEPLNPFDTPGYFLTDVDDAVQLIEKAATGNLFLQYDFYHQSRTRGELVATFDRLRPLIDHVQIAGNPGRYEPEKGEVNFDFVMAHLDAAGWEGFVGCEWTPRPGERAAELGWARRHLEETP
ncbi:MAG: TIM barrel protein [Rhizobiaceae bacterium]|nr:TIM barrel protein [Rhizobiaceae bacterium]MCV0408498.1 TIM barrel protein [Rhizobiaceae bacterium]